MNSGWSSAPHLEIGEQIGEVRNISDLALRLSVFGCCFSLAQLNYQGPVWGCGVCRGGGEEPRNAANVEVRASPGHSWWKSSAILSSQQIEQAFESKLLLWQPAAQQTMEWQKWDFWS